MKRGLVKKAPAGATVRDTNRARCQTIGKRRIQRRRFAQFEVLIAIALVKRY
jgi:hypothetical protein